MSAQQSLSSEQRKRAADASALDISDVSSVRPSSESGTRTFARTRLHCWWKDTYSAAQSQVKDPPLSLWRDVQWPGPYKPGLCSCKVAQIPTGLEDRHHTGTVAGRGWATVLARGLPRLSRSKQHQLPNPGLRKELPRPFSSQRTPSAALSAGLAETCQCPTSWSQNPCHVSSQIRILR